MIHHLHLHRTLHIGPDLARPESLSIDTLIPPVKRAQTQEQATPAPYIVISKAAKAVKRRFLINDPATTGTESPSHSPTDRIFFGPEGLRAGWGILLFVTLILTLSMSVNFLAHKSEQTFGHTAAPAASQPASRSKPPATSNDSPQPKESSPHTLYVGEGLTLLVVLTATFALSRIERRPFITYGLASRRRLPLFAQGLLYGLLCLSLLVATLHLTAHLPIDARLLPTTAAFRYGAIWAIAFTLVAFAEETLLRGYLQYTLTRGLRAILCALVTTRHENDFAFWSAALILSFLFGLGHGSNPGESPIGLLSAGLAGLVFSFALYRTGSLWWALGFHASWDWAQSFLYGVPDSGSMVQHHLLATHPVGPPILSGGLTGPEGSIFILPTLALVAAIIVLTLPQRAPGN